MWPVDNSVYLSIRQNAAKQAAAAATQTIAAAQNAAASNKNTAAHQQLVQSCKVRQPGVIVYKILLSCYCITSIHNLVFSKSHKPVFSSS